MDLHKRLFFGDLRLQLHGFPLALSWNLFTCLFFLLPSCFLWVLLCGYLICSPLVRSPRPLDLRLPSIPFIHISIVHYLSRSLLSLLSVAYHLLRPVHDLRPIVLLIITSIKSFSIVLPVSFVRSLTNPLTARLHPYCMTFVLYRELLFTH